MSKRFGRNQKRAMRERIANLEEAMAMEAALSKRKSRFIEEQHQALRRAAEALGKNHPAFPPESRFMREGATHYSMERQYIPAPMPMDRMDPMSLVETVHLLAIMSVRSRTDPIDGAMHFRIMRDNKQWGYAFNDEAIHSLSSRDMIQTISEELAEMIYADLARLK